MLLAIGQIAAAAILNLFAIYYLDKSKGFTEFESSFLVILFIVGTQYLLGKAFLAGPKVVSIPVAALVVSVMVGSMFIGIYSGKENFSWPKFFAIAVAAISVAIASTIDTSKNS